MIFRCFSFVGHLIITKFCIWHVENFVTITLSTFDWEQKEFSSKFDWCMKILSETGQAFISWWHGILQNWDKDIENILNSYKPVVSYTYYLMQKRFLAMCMYRQFLFFPSTKVTQVKSYHAQIWIRFEDPTLKRLSCMTLWDCTSTILMVWHWKTGYHQWSVAVPIHRISGQVKICVKLVSVQPQAVTDYPGKGHCEVTHWSQGCQK